jgi:tryptophan synthase alpha chain
LRLLDLLFAICYLLFCPRIMTNRIDEKFAALKAENRSAFIVYITGGDPSLDKTIEIASTLERAGADVLEIGVPFSDPLADGVANQLGAQRALQAGATLPRLLYTVSQIRTQVSVPIVLYSYLNPIFQYGFPQFEEDALAAGVDGVLLLDLPPEEAIDGNHPHLIHRIRLIAPTTPDERIRSITSQASGFVYYVSREGVTGERDDLASLIPERIGQIRNHTSLPIVVGFGISTPAQAAQVAAWADGVVVGSAIVRKIGELGNDPTLSQKLLDFVAPIAGAVHSVAKE